MEDRIRMRLGAEGAEGTLYGWATHDNEGGYGAEYGYTVEWDDTYEDHPTVRWFFGVNEEAENLTNNIFNARIYRVEA